MMEIYKVTRRSNTDCMYVCLPESYKRMKGMPTDGQPLSQIRLGGVQIPFCIMSEVKVHNQTIRVCNCAYLSYRSTYISKN